MRFFSNDKDSSDDQHDVDVQDRAEQVNPDQAHDDVHPERVSSDPVSVPQQRPGSPWSSAPDGGTSDARPGVAEDARPGVAEDARPGDAGDARPEDAGDATPEDAELADRERADGTDEGRPPFHEPAPQPTAFGASTVGGAVAASAMANPQNDSWSATTRDSAASSGVGDDRTVAPGDGVVADDRDGDPDGAPVAGSRGDDVVDVALDDQGNFDDPHVRDADTTTREDTTPPDARPDVAADGTVTDGGAGGTAAAGTLAGATAAGAAADRRADDRDGDRDRDGGRDTALKDDGTFDAPQAVDPDTDRPIEGGTGDGADRDTPLKDDGTFDAPQAVDPATDRPLDSPAQSAPVVAAVSTGTGGSAGSLFGADDATSLKERWRDVQLRFVDSPKEATTEAAGLLDEAVDRLAASLRAQKDRLSGDSGDDTEKLRVELRGYRDMLNRILDL
jgi:hypothetical protein